MKIGLLSDTHVPIHSEGIPQQVAEIFFGVDLILHAGDIYIPAVLDWLEKIAPVLACRGNGDWRGPPDPRLQDTQVVTADGLLIGLTHDLPLPEDPPYRTLEKIMDSDFGGPVDVIVFGHSHVETIQTIKGVLVVNPGSPTVPHNKVNQLGTVAILEIRDGKAEAQILPLG